LGYRVAGLNQVHPNRLPDGRPVILSGVRSTPAKDRECRDFRPFGHDEQERGRRETDRGHVLSKPRSREAFSWPTTEGRRHRKCRHFRPFRPLREERAVRVTICQAINVNMSSARVYGCPVGALTRVWGCLDVILPLWYNLRTFGQLDVRLWLHEFSNDRCGRGHRGTMRWPCLLENARPAGACLI